MKLLTKAIEKKLLANNAEMEASAGSLSLKPVVKYFNPTGAATWLISDMDKNGMMFGLADLGMGSPEMGYVMLEELESIKLPFGLGIERDLSFEADKTVSEYAKEASKAGYIAA
jgi:hypothetical protein